MAKYEVTKRQIDIDRQFNLQLVPADTSVKKKEKALSNTPSTITLMQRHRERSVQCKLCSLFYLEGQNNSTACRMHVMEYKLRCPKTCSAPGATSMCSSHR